MVRSNIFEKNVFNFFENSNYVMGDDHFEKRYQEKILIKNNKNDENLPVSKKRTKSIPKRKKKVGRTASNLFEKRSFGMGT